MENDAYTSVLGDRTRRPSVLDASREPVGNRRMMGVILVEQGAQDVDVQQGPQESDSQLFAKLVNELVGDDGAARRNGPEAV